MQQLEPSQAVAWSLRTLAVSGPLCLGTLGLVVLGALPGERPIVTMMVFLLFLAVSGVAACGALYGACSYGSSRAFSAGLKVGRQIGAEEGPPPTKMPALRVVE